MTDLGKFPEQKFGTNGALAQFGMCQIEIILFLEHVIRKLVAQTKTDSPRSSVFTDDIEPRDLCLLASVTGKFGLSEGLARRHDTASVALVGPFRLRPNLPGFRLAPL